MSSNSTPPLSTLVILGQEHRLWHDKMACAETLDMEYVRFCRHLLDQGINTDIEETRRKLENVLRTKEIDFATPEHERELPKDFRGMYFLGVRLALWKDISHCAKELGHDRKCIGRYIHEPEDAVTRTARGRNEYGEALGIIRKKVEPAFKKLRQQHKPVAAMPEGVVVSDWKDQLMTGELQIAEDPKSPLRFFLQAELLKDGPLLTALETKDTNALAKIARLILSELRRRYVLACQSQEGRCNGVLNLLPTGKALLTEAASIATIFEAMQETELQQQMRKYLELFRSQFEPLFPPQYDKPA